MKENLSAHYELASDIDLSSYNSVENELGTGFVPIGLDTSDPATPIGFTGSIKGNSFTIKNSTSTINSGYNALFAI